MKCVLNHCVHLSAPHPPVAPGISQSDLRPKETQSSARLSARMREVFLLRFLLFLSRCDVRCEDDLVELSS
jgi:hypothetical protein